MESKKKAIASWQSTETPRHRDADTHGCEQSESYGFTDIGIAPYLMKPMLIELLTYVIETGTGY